MSTRLKDLLVTMGAEESLAASVAENESAWTLANTSPSDAEAKLGTEAAARFLAAVELGMIISQGPATSAFANPGDAARYLLPRYSLGPVERFGAMYLDVRFRLIREQVISVGSLTASLVHPREVFGPALTMRAVGMVIFHNHPSGDPEPSAEDFALTRRLSAAGSLLGIEVYDHLVLGAGRFVSMKDRGAL